LAPLKIRLLRWALPVAILAGVILAYPHWLRGLGNFLVAGQQPFKADIIVVLSGDDRGNRILKACELVQQGWAPKILVSGMECCYGNQESGLEIAFAVRHGYPADWFIPLPTKGTSTTAEAREIVSALARRHVGRFIVVTSNYHTRRAARIYRGLVPAERFRMVAARDWIFRPGDWWRSRDGQKQCFLEWTKTLANWAGL
jgi:uncharacterized SAM-binding protein YcdF (DUF218 family)